MPGPAIRVGGKMGTPGIWVRLEGVAEVRHGGGGDHSANRERGRGDWN